MTAAETIATEPAFTATPAAPFAPTLPVTSGVAGPTEITDVASSKDDRPESLGKRFFNLKTGLSFLLGLVILVGLVKFTKVDPAEILAQLKQIDPRLYALAIGTYVLTFPVRGLRWQRLLSNVDIHVPVVPLTEVLFISWFVNSVVPGKLGDVYRGYLIKREYGHALSRTVGTVVAERVVDLLCLALLLVSTGYIVLRNTTSPEVAGLLRIGWIGIAVLLGGMLALYWFGERLMRFFPAKAQEIYGQFAHGTFASLKTVPTLSVLTLLAWSAEAGRLFFVMQSLHVHLSPIAALFTIAAISLALIAPTPGGLGGVEAAFSLVLTQFGVPLTLALAVAVLDRLISYYGIILTGLPIFIFTKRGR